MENENKGRKEAKKDGDIPEKNNFVYTAFLLGGVGYYLTNYCISGAVDYYQIRFPGTTFIFDVTATRCITSVIGYFVNNALIEATTFTWRIAIGYFVIASFMTFLTVGDVILRVFVDDVAYAVTIMVVAVAAIVQAVQQSSYYGYANMLPARHIQAVAAGESLSGVIVAAGRIATKLILDDERTNTIIFYFCCIVAIIICTIAFFTARHTKFVKHHLNKCKSVNTSNAVTEQEEEQIHTSNTTSSMYGTTTNGGLHSHQMAKETATQLSPLDGPMEDNSIDRGNQDSAYVPLIPSNRRSRIKAMLNYRWAVTKQIWDYLVLIAVINLVSIVLFPSIITEIVSCRLGSWMPVILMSEYNVFDLISRSLASLEAVQKSALRWLQCGSVSRMVFIPLVLLCCLPRSHPVLQGEGTAILIVSLLALSHGLFLVTSLTAASARVEEKDREMCGNLLMVSTVATMAAGVLISYLIDYLAGLTKNHDVCPVTWSNVTSIVNVTALPWEM